MKYIFFGLLAIIFFSCSGLQKTEYDKIRKKNITAERITRKHDDKLDLIKNPSVQKNEPYFWEDVDQIYLPKITKDFFRCRGHNKNPPKEFNKLVLSDCKGSSKHSLPLIHGRENVYQTLLDILNYIQIKMNQKVVVTCGYRCPKHNMYAEPTETKSYHMLGAEVDFYIKGYETQAESVIDEIMNYYKISEQYKDKNEYTDFKKDNDTKVWSNKEISIKYFDKSEGRDIDNRHPYPYISIRVKYDKDLKEEIVFSKSKAEKGYYKW